MMMYSDRADVWGCKKPEIDRLSTRIKELEDKLTVLQDHANGMGEIISNQTKIRIGLEGELTVVNEQVKELVEGIEQIEKMGHNDDCLMCAMKDTWARKLIEKEKPYLRKEVVE